MAGALHLHQAQQNQNRRNGLGNDGCQRDARNAHVEHDDKEQVQKDVDDAGQGQKVKRALGVADRPEDGRAKVVKHEGRHPHKVDAHVQHRLVDDIVRGAHQLQQWARQGNTDKDQKDAADQGGQNRGMYRAMYAVIVPRAVVARNHNVRADRDALNRSCKMPEIISGMEKIRILLKSGPLHISISYDFFMTHILFYIKITLARPSK